MCLFFLADVKINFFFEIPSHLFKGRETQSKAMQPSSNVEVRTWALNYPTYIIDPEGESKILVFQ